MNTEVAQPLIGIPANSHRVGRHAFQGAGEKYLHAIQHGVQGLPFIIPSLAEPLVCDEVLQHVDGILLTGSYSNVEPHHYAGPPSKPGTLHDPQRDRNTLPMIRAAVDRAVPLFAICRGFQEMNVAFGGTLHQEVHIVDGCDDHREDPDAELETQYGVSHAITIEPGGMLETVLQSVPDREVNSLHTQGVDRLGEGLVVEARAPDGLVEAFSVAGAKGFALAVQWHPEWRATENPLSMALFGAFGQACRQFRAKRERV
jgi:putative glutamine amidotransferase